MNMPNQDIRNQFLTQACYYLFGPHANCASLSTSFGLPALQPITVRSDAPPR